MLAKCVYRRTPKSRINWRAVVQAVNCVLYLLVTGVTIYQLANIYPGHVWAIATFWVTYTLASVMFACVLELNNSNT